MLRIVRDLARYTAGLVRYQLAGFDAASARRDIEAGLATRAASFLDVVERAIYANPRSPFRKLLAHAGIEMPDVRRLVDGLGLEAALAQLYERGVYLTVEEVKGRVPVRRGDLEFSVAEGDLDNPLSKRHLQATSSGSTGQPTHVYTNFDGLLSECAYVALLAQAHDVGRRPVAIWRPLPPDNTGLNSMLRYRKIGQAPERWFSQAPLAWRRNRLRSTAFLLYTLLVTRLILRPMPFPRHVPRDHAVVIARWFAEKKARAAPAFLDTSASGATRICLAAREHGLDISGSVFRVGGEPVTPAKFRIIEDAGVRVLNRYSMTEIGMIGLGCADPGEFDDLHLTTDQIVVTQRDKGVGTTGITVPALVFTTTRPTCRQVLLNAESGDYGILRRRDCGCLLGEIGLTTHLTGLRSYDKLTSEGVSFMGSELFDLMESVLPARFGGYATDYQLVEEEEGGLSRVSIIVSPTVGEIDESAVIATVLSALDAYFRPERRMADQWRGGDTLRVLRREPYVSGSRKVLPLHVLRPPTR